MKERRLPVPDSSAENWELHSGDSGYAPHGYDGTTDIPGTYPGYDPRINIFPFPFYPIVPFPILPPPFFGFPPPFFPRRRYW
ncbi:MAG: hypothetical protein ACOYEF_14065 [Planifilum sp.]|jgi:hypothetical protein